MPPKIPKRPGAFSANFDPDTLSNFRDHCTSEGRQYTKVLEKLAEIYLLTNGEILNATEIIDNLTLKVCELERQLQQQGKIGSLSGQIPSTDLRGQINPLFDNSGEMSADTAVGTGDLYEDLKDFYPPPEINDWRQGWAVMKAGLQQLKEQLDAVTSTLVFLQAVPKERPIDELSISADDPPESDSEDESGFDSE